VVEWDRRGRDLVVTGQPVREMSGRLIPRGELHEYPDDPTTVRLRPEQVEELARFVRGGPTAEG
jgi:hypothetical protein